MVDQNRKWIRFESTPNKPGAKTGLWIVRSLSDGTPIGLVRWIPGWRTYGYFPYEGTMYEDDCLRDIAQFIVDRMQERKA